MVAFEQNTPRLLLVDLDFEESFNFDVVICGNIQHSVMVYI